MTKPQEAARERNRPLERLGVMVRCLRSTVGMKLTLALLTVLLFGPALAADTPPQNTILWTGRLAPELELSCTLTYESVKRTHEGYGDGRSIQVPNTREQRCAVKLTKDGHFRLKMNTLQVTWLRDRLRLKVAKFFLKRGNCGWAVFEFRSDLPPAAPFLTRLKKVIIKSASMGDHCRLLPELETTSVSGTLRDRPMMALPTTDGETRLTADIDLSP
jgi:hypothetical protein